MWKGQLCVLIENKDIKHLGSDNIAILFPLRIYSINFVSHYKSAVVIPFLLMTDLWVFIWYKQTISISLEQDSSWNYLFFTLPNKEKIHCKFLTIHQIIHKAADLWLYTARQCILDIWLMTVQHELSEPYSPTWLLWLPTISLNRDTKFDYCVPIKKDSFFQNHYLSSAIHVFDWICKD